MATPRRSRQAAEAAGRAPCSAADHAVPGRVVMPGRRLRLSPGGALPSLPLSLDPPRGSRGVGDSQFKAYRRARHEGSAVSRGR